MKKLVHILMLSCKKATMLIEKSMLVKLSFKDKVQLTLHKSMCDACTAYEKQSKKMDEILKQHIHDNPNSDAVQNENLKDKIIQSLNKI
jgi:hypothetical protein